MTRPSKAGRRARPFAEMPPDASVPDARARRQWVVPALAVAFLLSGSAGLIHEVVWVRLLAHVFGASAPAISTVLAAFMAGLAIGSRWIGARARKLADPRRTYATLELGIGVCALLIPLLLAAVSPFYAWLWRHFHLSFTAFTALRFVVASTILLGPTIMMGATLPLLADYLAGLEGRRLSPEWLYTVNLVGAVLGVVLAGFVLMPAIGVWGTIVTSAGINLAVGLAVWRLPAVPRKPVRDGVASAPERSRRMSLLLVIAFLSGLISLATQVAWTRVLTLVVGSTTYAFSSILLVYLAALGTGSAWASRRSSSTADVRADLAVAHLLMAVLMLGALYTVNRLPRWYLALYGAFAPRTMPAIVALDVVIVFAVLFWPVVCAGTILPLALIGSVPLEGGSTGVAVGRIYAVNTAGAIAGSLLAGFVLVPVLGAQYTLLGLAAAGALTGAALAFGSARPRWLPAASVVAVALIVVGMVTSPRWNVLELNAGVFEPGRLGTPDDRTLGYADARALFHREGRTASVLVVERTDGSRHLVINARTNASTNPPDMASQVLLAQLPLLVASRADDVLVIGWGSGVTVGAATQSAAKRIRAVEIEPVVVEASRLFDDMNHQPLADPRVSLYEDDARHILLASDETYDVVISEPPHPWVSGVADLFTQDFYRLLTRRLRPDGVVAQWLQTYQISFDSYRSVVASFQSVLPEVVIFNPPGGSDTILLGSRRPLTFDLEDMHRRWADERVREEMARASTPSPEHLLSGCLVGPEGVRAMVAGAQLNTDDNMKVEFAGPRDAMRPPVETVKALAAGLRPFAIAPEGLLVDATALFSHHERIRALIDGLRLHGRSVARYQAVLGRGD